LPATALAAGETLNQGIGNVASGKTVRVFYSVTVGNTLPSGSSNISNQGTVSQSGGPAILTGDPDETNPGDPNDATLTPAFGSAPSSPEIDVQGSAMSIAGDGSNIPMPADGTNFGSSPVGVGTAENVFVISNSTAGQTLNIGVISIGGANASDFGITTNPSSGAIVGVGTVNLGITFTPSAVGARSATVTIPNDDPDENPYVFSVAGFGDPPTDTTPPVISGTKDIIVNVESGGTSDPIFYAPTATDETAPAMPAVTCSPMPGGTYAAGTVTVVTCSATDAAGNTAMATFNIVALIKDETPGERFLDTVSLRGDAAVGATGTIFNINRAFLNNAGEVIYDAALSGAGANNSAVFVGPVAGPHPAVAVKGTASGAGNYGNFRNLALNDDGDATLQSQLGANPGQFVDTGGGPAVAAVKAGVAPTGGGETYNVLHRAALASNGELLTPASLLLGSGAGVTVGDDTILTSSAGTVIAREGDPTSVAGIRYSHFHPRAVTSENNDRYAFTTFLSQATFDPATNTGVFADVLGGGLPAIVIQEGDPAAGTGGGVFSTFSSEVVNSAGEVAVRANATGTGINSTNNEGIWTNSGNTAAPPVLVAREGDVAPCLPTTLVAFSRFSTLHIGDDGSVCFFAFLKDATATPAVNSSNDGSIWRWTNGELHLVVREGDLANNTDAVVRTVSNLDCSGSGGIVYQTSYVLNVGDTETANSEGIYVDRGGSDPAPILIMRRGDIFDLSGSERTVVGLRVNTESNAGKGTGGYGRAINDMGSVLLNLTLSGGSSGIFVLGTAPPATN